MVMQAHTLRELADVVSEEYFINDKYGGDSVRAYIRAKQLSDNGNHRTVTATRRKLQHIIGSLALIEGWIAHTWRDTGGGIAGQSPTDYYFDMTLAKHECMFFVYIHGGKGVTLNVQQRQWCLYAREMGIPVQHWTIHNITPIYRLLRTQTLQ